MVGSMLKYAANPFATPLTIAPSRIWYSALRRRRGCRRCRVRTVAGGLDRSNLAQYLRDLRRRHDGLAGSEKPQALLRNRLLEVADNLGRIRIAAQLSLSVREVRAQCLVPLFIKLIRVAVEVNRDHFLHG